MFSSIVQFRVLLLIRLHLGFLVEPMLSKAFCVWPLTRPLKQEFLTIYRSNTFPELSSQVPIVNWLSLIVSCIWISLCCLLRDSSKLLFRLLVKMLVLNPPIISLPWASFCRLMRNQNSVWIHGLNLVNLIVGNFWSQCNRLLRIWFALIYVYVATSLLKVQLRPQ